MVEVWSKETCKCCGGSGVQTGYDGIRRLCPTCNGTGQRNVSNMENLPPGIYCMASRHHG
jgi:DnaJ-class molecular chaperone